MKIEINQNQEQVRPLYTIKQLFKFRIEFLMKQVRNKVIAFSSVDASLIICEWAKIEYGIYHTPESYAKDWRKIRADNLFKDDYEITLKDYQNQNIYEIRKKKVV